MTRLLDQFPFESNVFCMTRFPNSDEAETTDPLAEVISVARATLDAAGFRLHLASDRNADDELFGNIAGHMWACQYGIALVEDRVGRGLNQNMLIEVGAMLMTGRRCSLLKDVSAPEMPTDFVGHIYTPVDFDDTDAVQSSIREWASEIRTQET